MTSRKIPFDDQVGGVAPVIYGVDLINGWVADDAEDNPPRYWKDPTGTFVTISPGILNGAGKTSNIPFILPVGFRPYATLFVPTTSQVLDYNALTRLEIQVKANDEVEVGTENEGSPGAANLRYTLIPTICFPIDIAFA